MGFLIFFLPFVLNSNPFRLILTMFLSVFGLWFRLGPAAPAQLRKYVRRRDLGTKQGNKSKAFILCRKVTNDIVLHPGEQGKRKMKNLRFIL